MSRVMSEFKIVRVIPTGSGSKRITIPKAVMTDVLGDAEYVAIVPKAKEIIIQPVPRPSKA
jgi:hypothetical protein